MFRDKRNSNYRVERVGEARPTGAITCHWCWLPIHKWHEGEMNCPHCGNRIRVTKDGRSSK